MKCVHHMRISTPKGPKVKGVCKKCGFTREYDAGEHGEGGKWKGERQAITVRPSRDNDPGGRGRVSTG